MLINTVIFQLISVQLGMNNSIQISSLGFFQDDPVLPSTGNYPLNSVPKSPVGVRRCPPPAWSKCSARTVLISSSTVSENQGQGDSVALVALLLWPNTYQDTLFWISFISFINCSVLKVATRDPLEGSEELGSIKGIHAYWFSHQDLLLSGIRMFFFFFLPSWHRFGLTSRGNYPEYITPSGC